MKFFVILFNVRVTRLNLVSWLLTGHREGDRRPETGDEHKREARGHRILEAVHLISDIGTFTISSSFHTFVLILISF